MPKKKTFIAVGHEDGTTMFNNIAEATEWIRNSFDEALACDFIRDIYDSDKDGDEIEGGKRYGCNWSLTLEEL